MLTGINSKVLERGVWLQPQLFGVLDDRSRLCCHLQWYLDETAEALVHGVSQAMQKRKLPRSLMTDGGAAMRAEETWRGLEELGVVHELTLPESPYQNGKQESFWGQVEGRLMPMLEGVVDLDLRLLKEATQAWVELEYNKKIHSELGVPPLRRYLEGPDVGRPCPDSETLRNAFRRKVGRTQRRSDGTIQLEARRFELPSRLRQTPRVVVGYAKSISGSSASTRTRRASISTTGRRRATCSTTPQRGRCWSPSIGSRTLSQRVQQTVRQRTSPVALPDTLQVGPTVYSNVTSHDVRMHVVEFRVRTTTA